MSPPDPSPPPDILCKSHLQQYTQRASIPFPAYITTNEGSQHAPQFRSQVWVDGTCFISPNTFSTKKMAEQDAAKHALIGIREKVKDEGSKRVREDTVFCKSAINEYAKKLNLDPPTYATNESKAFLPVFVSSMVLNGVIYVGAPAKSKKEAEQLAARSAILSILESESSTTMSEIVRSKFEYFDAFKNFKDPSGVQGGTLPAGVKPLEDFMDSPSVQIGNVRAGMKPSEGSGAFFSVNKRKEVDVSGDTVTGNSASVPQSSSLTSCPAIQVGLPESTLGQLLNTQATGQPFHEFKKPKTQSPSVVMPPTIVFVPPASEQPPICSTSGKKKRRKNKKAKTLQNQSALTVDMIPQAPVPALSVAQ